MCFFLLVVVSLVVSASAVGCLERLVSKMTNYSLNSTHSLTLLDFYRDVYGSVVGGILYKVYSLLQKTCDSQLGLFKESGH